MTKLYPFQVEGVEALASFRGRALLADEQGLGKTLEALSYLSIRPKRRPAIIVCPAVVKYTWQAEAMLHFGLRADVLEGRPKRRAYPPMGPITILNYEILRDWLPLLLRTNPRCIIFDEVHYCKNHLARRTRASFKLAKDRRSVIGISGTPMINRPIELWPVLHLICPELFPSRVEYAWRYCKPRLTTWGWRYDGSSRRKELRALLLENCMIRRKKRDVWQQLPPKTRKLVVNPLGNYEEYAEAERDFIGWLHKISPAKAAKARRSEALSKIGYLLRLVSKLKLPWVLDWIDEFLTSHPKEKLVAFSMHRSVIDAVAARFPGCLVLDGRTKTKGGLRSEIVRRFQTDARCRLFMGNWRAAGIGITLTAASNVAALDLPWTPGDLLQGEDRLDRIGQKHPVTAHYLASLGTIELKQFKVLRAKSKVLDSVFDGGRQFRDLDLFEELLKEMSHAKK